MNYNNIQSNIKINIDNINENADNKCEKKTRGKSKVNNDECYELNNIKYKTMLLTGTNITYVKTSDISNIDVFLEEESKLNKLEPWCKLDKTDKIDKLNCYIDELNKRHKLSLTEYNDLKIYIQNCLDKKHLYKVKDVQYDKENGVIKNIPSLYFNKTTRKFSLKKSDKYISTTKALGPRKKTVKNQSLVSSLDELKILDE